jgi:2-polyprenyl-3-methyl-5-hydroxy-6-metoxy-1,4-benzoquinol methylase
MTEPGTFYDELADDYHLVYQDWREAVPRQGRMLAVLIREVQGHDRARRVLDCTCGIGTQAIGLALEGFTVTGTDISPRSVARARREAHAFGVRVGWGVADVRRLEDEVPGRFDVVISCDNSLAHLLTDDDLGLALAGMRAKLEPGGLVLIGTRNNDQLRAERPRFTPPQLVEREGERSVLFQLWDWEEDGAIYHLTMFRHRQVGPEWFTSMGSTRSRAISRAELERALAQAGFVDLAWHEPAATGHHQPLLSAVRAA